MDHSEYHEAQRQAQLAHRARLQADGAMGETKTVSCILSPGDNVKLQRIGMPKGSATYLSLTMEIHGQRAMVALSPANARKLAAALLDGVEECDPTRPVLALPDFNADDAKDGM